MFSGTNVYLYLLSVLIRCIKLWSRWWSIHCPSSNLNIPTTLQIYAKRHDCLRGCSPTLFYELFHFLTHILRCSYRVNSWFFFYDSYFSKQEYLGQKHYFRPPQFSFISPDDECLGPWDDKWRLRPDVVPERAEKGQLARRWTELCSGIKVWWETEAIWQALSWSQHLYCSYKSCFEYSVLFLIYRVPTHSSHCPLYSIPPLPNLSSPNICWHIYVNAYYVCLFMEILLLIWE